MKRGVLLFFLCLWGGLAYSQQLLDQRISLKAEGVLLETVLYQLMDQEAINLSFSNDIIPAQSVSINAQNLPVRQVLRQLLDNTSLRFKEVGRQVLIFPAPRARPKRIFTISGFLSDEASQERLMGATIYEQTSGKGTITNEFGFFSLSIPEGEIDLAFSFLGYTPRIRQIQLDSNKTINMSLSSSVMLAEVEVIGKTWRTGTPDGRISTNILDPKMVEEMPGLGGEADLLRAAYLLPGVQTGTDGVGGMFVRGGNPGQNLVLIDDVPVYNVYHAAGMLSVFNTQAVRSAKLLKGGFPARYGGRVSSVLDIRTKDGNAREWSAQAEAGLLTGRFSAEGPILKNKSSIFVSGRFSYLDWYFKPISEGWKAEQGEQGATSYRYFDLNAKFNYSFSDKDRLYISFYNGSDRYGNYGQFGNTISLLDVARDEIILFRTEQTYSEALTWGNTVASLRWNHVFGNKLFANATFTYSKLAVDIDYRETDRLVRIDPATELFDLLNVGQFYSGIEDYGGKIDFDFVPSPSHYVRFGIGLTRRSFLPGALSFSGINEDIDFEGNILNDPIHATESVLYVEDEMTFGDRWLVNAGLRFENLQVEGQSYGILQPRLYASYALSDRVSLKASASSMAQFLHLLSQSGIALPTDLWVSATGQIEPQRAWQFEAGSVIGLGKGMSLTVEGYYKAMDNLITYTEGANILNNWEENVTQGQGTAYGAEIMLQRQAGKTTGWLSYTLSWVDRQFDLVNLGRPYPFKFDRRHDIKLVLNHKLNDWCTLTGNWQFSTGFAFSLPFERYIFQEPGSPQDPVVIEDFDAINKYRMPFYHRLDLGAQFEWKSKNLEQKLHLGAYNVYNRRNPLYYNLRTEIVNRNNALEVVKQFVEVPLLPILPSVRYSVKF